MSAIGAMTRWAQPCPIGTTLVYLEPFRVVARDGFDPVPRDGASLHAEWSRWHDDAIAIQAAASAAAWAAIRSRLR